MAGGRGGKIGGQIGGKIGGKIGERIGGRIGAGYVSGVRRAHAAALKSLVASVGTPPPTDKNPQEQECQGGQGQQTAQQPAQHGGGEALHKCQVGRSLQIYTVTIYGGFFSNMFLSMLNYFS